MRFEIEEMTPTDLGLEMNRWGDYTAEDNIWDEVDTHTCYMEADCVGFQHGSAAPIATHLRGEYDQPHWYTPWKFSTYVNDVVTMMYVCEDCTVYLAAVLNKVGFTETVLEHQR
jgi:hypothetical protein